MYRKLKRVWSHNNMNYIPKFKETFPELSKVSSEEMCNRFASLGIDFYTDITKNTMELLTGKCKEAFAKYIQETKIGNKNYPLGNVVFFSGIGTKWNDLMECVQYGLLVEFFDSVGIYISVNAFNDLMLGYHRGFEYEIYNESNNEVIKDNLTDVVGRPEATRAAIIRANDLFNE